MSPDSMPLKLLLCPSLLGSSAWKPRVNDYLAPENRILKEQLGGKRLRLTDKQRRRLAAMAKLLGRKIPTQIATIVTPDRLSLAAETLRAKWTHKSKRQARPGIMKEIRMHIVRMATENSSWA